jgi:hypothetical protein
MCMCDVHADKKSSYETCSQDPTEVANFPSEGTLIAMLHHFQHLSSLEISSLSFIKTLDKKKLMNDNYLQIATHDL